MSSTSLDNIGGPTHDTPPHPWPGLWSRVVGVSIGQTSICPPHHTLKLEELLEERWSLIVDFLGIDRYWHISFSRRGLRLIAHTARDYWSRCTIKSYPKLGSCCMSPVFISSISIHRQESRDASLPLVARIPTLAA